MILTTFENALLKKIFRLDFVFLQAMMTVVRPMIQLSTRPTSRNRSCSKSRKPMPRGGNGSGPLSSRFEEFFSAEIELRFLDQSIPCHLSLVFIKDNLSKRVICDIKTYFLVKLSAKFCSKCMLLCQKFPNDKLKSILGI